MMEFHSMQGAGLLTNRKGGYALLTTLPHSRYDGVHLMSGNRMFKIIDRLTNDEPIKDVCYKMWALERRRSTFREQFFTPIGMDCLMYETSREVTIGLTLDMRDAYDMRDWGRIYEVHEDENYCTITFTKITDHREDESDGDVEFRLYLVIDKENISIARVDSWDRTVYPYDSQRAGREIARFLHTPINITGSRICMAYGTDRKAAIEELELLKRHAGVIQDDVRHYTATLVQRHADERSSETLANACSLNAVEKLMIHEKEGTGMIAGLPWFFQRWARDELISTGSLIVSGRLEEASEILSHYIPMIDTDGRLPNRSPATELGSIDAMGWLVKRVDDFLEMTAEMGNRQLYVSDIEMAQISHELEVGIKRFIEHNSVHGLIYNGPKETWMDTAADGRQGFRIEIQAMFARMYAVMYKLTADHQYKKAEHELRDLIRAHFWDGSTLHDGSEDKTIRPNAFIAGYIYPNILTTDEWRTCIDTMTQRLWLSWGGLSTIDTRDPHFVDRYTGEDDRSYHSGDSWFFLNNMAAILMHHIDKDHFRDRIMAIYEASMKEILEMGIIGAHAEVSSA